MMHIGFRAHDLGTFTTIKNLARKAASFKNPVTIQLALKKVLVGAKEPSEYTSEYVRTIHDDLASEGVSIAVIGCYINPIHPDPEIRKRMLRDYATTLRFAKDFGCKVVGTETGSVHPDCSYCPDTYEPKILDAFRSSLEYMIEAAERYDATACIEAVNHAHTICSIERMAGILEQYPSEHLGVIYDPVNLIGYTGIPEPDGSFRRRPSREAQARYFKQAFDAFGPRIRAIHVKDFILTDNGTKIGDLTAGTGVMDWKLFSEELDAYHINVPCLLENLNPDTLPATLACLS